MVNDKTYFCYFFADNIILDFQFVENPGNLREIVQRKIEIKCTEKFRLGKNLEGREIRIKKLLPKIELKKTGSLKNQNIVYFITNVLKLTMLKKHLRNNS